MLRRTRLSLTPPKQQQPVEALLVRDRRGASQEPGFLRRLRLAWGLLADEAARILATPLDRVRPQWRWMLQPRDDAFEVSRTRGWTVETLGRIPEAAGWPNAPVWRELRASDRVELRLDPGRMVRQRLPLPAGSADFAAAVIDHRLERLTPWQSHDVVYGFALEPGSRTGTLEIDFAATSREIAQDALERLDRLEVRPTALGSASDPIERPLVVNLLTGTAASHSFKRHRRLRRGCQFALPLTLLLFLTSLALRVSAQDELDTATITLERQRLVLQARGTGGGDEGMVSGILAQKTPDLATFVLLDRLAAALPDDTVATDIEVTTDRVQIKGRSANAPALVPMLEGSANLTDVQFQSAVIREASGGDRFDITARRAPPGEAAP